jgi:hypothetical protein
MIEAEWLACTDPDAMLEFLIGLDSETMRRDLAKIAPEQRLGPLHIRAHAARRKLLLYNCGCCRHIWHLLIEQADRKAVEVAEKYADGGATNRQCQEASQEAAERFHRLVPIRASAYAHFAAATVGNGFSTSDCGRKATGGREAELLFQLNLLLDIFGNPFRPVAVDPSCLTWNAGTVVQLAQAIYADRAFDRLPILADALEDAGCHNAEILAHCRELREHVRGCWVVDLLLCKT